MKLCWLSAISILSISSAAFAEVPRTTISALNGRGGVAHGATMTVKPGDMITLSADQSSVDDAGQINDAEEFAEDFHWRSYTGPDLDRLSDNCDPSQGCAGTAFIPNEYGVSFLVPEDMPAQIKIIVQNKITRSFDQITLVNAYGDRYVRPTTVVASFDDYGTQSFDFDRALYGHGSWIHINETRVFVPVVYQVGWQPYQNGRWYWTDHGWTWISYDPWGQFTDHYGYWRHHGVYGWVWVPFHDNRWRPAVVTWFHTDAGIGWYPYYGDYARGYNDGARFGYDDGYWAGYNAGWRAAHPCWGPTFVTYNGFMSRNIYEVRETNTTVIYGHYSSYSSTTVVWSSSPRREIVEVRMGRPVEIMHMQTSSRTIVGGGTIQVVQPLSPVTAPPQYTNVRYQMQQNVTSGARVTPGTNISNTGSFQRPAALAVSAPAIQKANGSFTPMAVRTRTPITSNDAARVQVPTQRVAPSVTRPVTQPEVRPSVQVPRQSIPEVRQPTPAPRQTTPEFRQPTPHARQSTPEFRQPTQPSRTFTPEVRPSVPARQSTPEYRQPIPRSETRPSVVTPPASSTVSRPRISAPSSPQFQSGASSSTVRRRK